MTDTKTQIKTFISTSFLHGQDPSVLGDDTSLERAHIIDSAGMLDLILFIEDKFGFQVENDDAVPDNFDSVDAIVAYIERKNGS
jgi:acyl carrier protein